MVVPLHVSQVFRFKDSGRRTHSSQASSSSLCQYRFQVSLIRSVVALCDPFLARSRRKRMVIAIAIAQKSITPECSVAIADSSRSRGETLECQTQVRDACPESSLASRTSPLSAVTQLVVVRLKAHDDAYVCLHFTNVKFLAGMRRDDILRRFRISCFDKTQF